MKQYFTGLFIFMASTCIAQKPLFQEGISDTMLFSAMNLDYSGLEEVKTAVLNHDYTAAKNAYYNFRLTKSKSLWFFQPAKKTEHIIGYNTKRADSLCQHFLGPGKGFQPPNYFMGNNLNWTHNPMDSTKENYTLEWVYSLNRMTYWNELIDAYQHTSNEKYSKEWIYEMEDWEAKNPVPLNVSIYQTLNWRGSGWNWVNGHCMAVKLKSDMVTFDGEPKDITPPHFFEAAHMVKRFGKYYLMFSDGKAIDATYKVGYAVGNSPLGPWKEGANSPILFTSADSTIYGPGHHTVFREKGQDYILYHRIFPQKQDYVLRQLCIDSLNFDENKEIKKITPKGVKNFTGK